MKIAWLSPDGLPYSVTENGAPPASLEDVVLGYLAAGRGTAGLQLN